MLCKRDAYQRSLEAIQEAPLAADDFNSQAQLLCQACLDEIGADGCTIYLQPGHEETGFRRAAQAGTTAEETGPGTVKDLIKQAWDSGEQVESRAGDRCIVSVPVWFGHSGGGVAVAIWNKRGQIGDSERGLMKSLAAVASLLAPRFSREEEFDRVKMEIQNLRGEIAQESHLAGVGRLASGVAHELSQPLNAVLAMVSSLLRTCEDETASRRLQIIADAVQKCKTIIEKLLVYTRTSVAKENNMSFSRFVRASTDLSRVLAETLEFMRDSFNENSIAITVKYAQLPQVRANSTQWSQAFTALLAFLCECLKVGKTVTPYIKVATAFSDGGIQVKFNSNCLLFDESEAQRIFEPFFANSHSHLESCMSLGMVREVVYKHNGTVEAEFDPSSGLGLLIKVPVDDAENQ